MSENRVKYEKYTDYVIRNGRLVGEFEEMYRDFADPWQQTTRERFSSEKAVALSLLARLKQDLGVTIIMVEHDMKLVHAVSDRVLALASGRILALGTSTEVQNDPEVIRAYIGSPPVENVAA